MKKILFLITTLGNGGAERVLVDLVNHLDKKKFDVTVQTVIDTGSRIDELSSDVHYKTLISVKSKILLRILFRLIRKELPAKWIYKRFIKENYDIEVAFLEGLPTKIIAASDNCNSRKIAWVHNDLMQFFGSVQDYGSFKENRAAYEKFDNIVGVSQDVVDLFRQRFEWQRENTCVLYNVNDDRAIRQKAKQEINLPVDNGRIYIVACGRLTAQKGFERLLRIHKRLLENGLVHDVWIIGEGDERTKLEKYIRENNLSDTVTLFGFQKNPYPMIAKADLFVCSSIAEGYSMVLTEACILGTPVITTKFAGALEPKECPRYSVLCENDEESLYQAMKNVLQNPQEIERFKKEMEGKEKYFRAEYQVGQIENFLLK